MKNLITYLKTLWSWVSGSQRKKIGVTLGEATIEHPFSTYSAPFGTCWQPSGKLHSVVRYAAMLVMLFTLGIGQMWGADLAVNDVIIIENFKGGTSSTSFSAQSYSSTYSSITMAVSGDASSLSLSSANACFRNSSATNMDSHHAWLNKSTAGYIEIDDIPLHNVTKFQAHWAQSAKVAITFKYKFNGESSWTSGGASSAAANADATSNEITVPTGKTSVSIQFVRASNTTNQRIDKLSLVVTAIAAATPSLTADPTSLGWGTVAQGSSPSTKSFTISGSNLTGNLSVAVTGGYSVSCGSSITVTSGSPATTTITVTPPSTSTTGAKDGTVTISGGSLASNVTVNLTMTVAASHTVTFKNNGVTLSSGGTRSVIDGAEVGDLPVLTSGDACDPTSTTFIGWTESVVGTKQAARPTLITSSTTISADKVYNAVWAKGTRSNSTTTFERITSQSDITDGLYVVMIHGDNNALNTSLGRTALSSGTTLSNPAAGVKWTAVISGNKVKFKDSSNQYLGTNAITNNNAVVANGTYQEWTISTDQGGYSGAFNLNNGNDLEYYSSTFKVYAWSNNYKASYPFYIYVPQISYTDYLTNCCTPLASINGAIKSISGTSATLKWDNLSGVHGTTPYTVTVSPSAGTSVGAISTVDGYKNCTVSGLTAGTAYTFTINAFGDASHCDASQEVAATTPKITLGSASGTSIYIEGSGPGSKQTFTVTAVGLTGNLTVEAPTNFEVCATENGTYQSSITLTQSSGSVSTTVYFRLVADKTAASSPYAGSVTVSGGSATEQTVAVNGTVSPACENPTINTQPAASASYNLNVTATALSVVATKNGTGPALTYQWYSNTANSKTTPTPSPIDGATSASYTPPTTATGTKYYFCEVSSGACAVTTNISAITINTPSITVSKTSIAFGDQAKDGSHTETFTVTGTNLAYNTGLTLAISGSSYFTIDKSSVAQTSAGAVSSTTITVTYAPTAIGNDHSATITVSSTGATSKTVTLSGNSKYKITWIDKAATPAVTTYTYVASGKPTFPSDPTGGCDTYTYFYGWAEGTFTTPVTSPGPSSTIKVYKSADDMPAVSGDVTYYAVWCNAAPADYSTTYTSNVTLPTSGTYVYSATATINENTYSGAKIGKSGGGGSSSFTVPSGTKKIFLHTVNWNNEDNTLTLSSGTAGVTISPNTAITPPRNSGMSGSDNDFTLATLDGTQYKEYTLTGVSSTATINVASSSRLLVWGINATSSTGTGDCVTNCCTDVAARSGSVSMGTTSATVSWSVTGTAASKISSWDVSCEVTSSGASAGTKGSLTTDGTTKSITFTGLTANTGYTFHILGTSNDDAYCDVDDELTGTTECQTPSSLSIASTNDKWDFCAGETMTLTVSGTNISGSATYQWKKHNGSSWDNIAGATSASYSTTMAAAKAGQYCCTVTNPGSGSCDATTSGVWVRVWQLHLGDDDIDFTYVSGTTGSNSTVHLNSDTHYEFKLKDNNGGWFGLNDKTITATISAFALNGTGSNVNVTSGLEGNYTFTINYSDKNYPTIAVTYPTANQTANYDIWFDKSVVDGWNVAQTSDLFLRIGNSSENKNNVTESVSWSLVPGTDRFYTIKTLAATGFEAWQIANNTSWSGSNSIYLVNGSGYAITKGTTFQKYIVDASGVTLVPVLPSSGSGDGCAYYEVTKTIGMLTHTATITPPTNGTIQLEYTDVNSAAQTKTATTAGLAHRTLIKATATPAPGYQLTTFTVTPEGGAARSLVATNGQANNDTLEINSTYAATFSAKTITITWDENEGNTPSPTTSSYTYNGSTVSLATVTHATKLFAGWWTDPSAGTQITEIGTTNKPTDDVTYYAHWVDGNTVYFHPGVGSVTPTSATQATIGGSVSIPTPTIDCDGWSFAGWNVGSELAETTTNPEASLVAGGSSYVPASAAVHMYAVWKKNFGGGTGTVTNTYTWETTNNAWLTSSISGVTTYSTIAHTGTYAGEMSATSAYVQFLTKLSSPLSFKIYYTQTSNNDNSANKWNVQISDNGSSWTTVTSSEGANKSYKNTWRELDVDLSSYSNKYVRVAWGSANSGSFVLDDVSVSYTGTIPDAWKWTSTADDYGCVPANQVKTPVISPDVEAQTGDVSVTITCATDGATIRYTTDGTNPSSSTGTVYSGAFTVSCSATVKAIAYKATMDDSEIASQAYTITVPTPTFSLAEGTYYDANQSVTLSLPTAHTGTVIKYTTNGDDPTSSSATYSSAITVTEGTTTIKAIGYNSTCSTSSSVASATYIVRFGTDYTLVTNVDDLNAGDQVVMVSADATTSTHHAISTTISSNKRTATTDFNLNAGLTTAKIYPALGAAATVQVFTLGGSPGAWTFHETTNNGYLNCPSEKKLTNTATVSNSNRWTITIASNIATIHNNAVDATIKSNTSSDHVFAAYGPLTENVQLVKLYSIPNPDPLIKVEADLSAFSACRGSASDYQSFIVSGKNLDGNIVISGPTGYEFCLTSGGSYTATLNIEPVTKTVAKTTVYVRLAATATAGAHNGNLNAAVSANSLSTNIAVTGSVSTADTFTDQVHNTVVANECGSYLAPSCADTGTPADASCVETHFKFMGWITETDRNASGVKDDAWYMSHLITAGTAMTANGTNYYAVWAREEE